MEHEDFHVVTSLSIDTTDRERKTSKRFNNQKLLKDLDSPVYFIGTALRQSDATGAAGVNMTNATNGTMGAGKGPRSILS